MAAFGSEARVAVLSSLLEQLNDAGVECMICSRGLVGPIRKCLDQLGLLQFFTKVYANTGDSYGWSDFDKKLTPAMLGDDAKYLASPLESSGWGSKAQLISRCLAERGFRGEDAFLSMISCRKSRVSWAYAQQFRSSLQEGSDSEK